MVLSDLLQEPGIARRDAEVLLQHLLGVTRSFLYAHPEEPISRSTFNKWQRLVTRRQAHEPIAHLTHSKEFYGREYYVNRSTLIPRPETEEMVSRALAWITKENRPIRILEIGTGSGCISLTLAKESALTSEIIATEISSPALKAARINRRRLGVSPRKLRFLHADLFNHPQLKHAAPFDLIIANLPYLPDTYRSSIPKEVSLYEPPLALFAGADGLELYDRFIADAPSYLSSQGLVLLECDYSHAQLLKEKAARAFAGRRADILSDQSGKKRFISIS